MTRDRLDDRIDSVAREMTSGAPRADFRARVLSRLESAARPLWWRPTAIVPIAAMVIIAVAVGIRERSFRENHTASGMETRTEAGVRSSQPGAQTIPPRTVMPSAEIRDRGTSTAPTRIARRAATAEPTMDMDTMDELAPPPLEVAAIPMDGIATSRLELPTLAMPTIAMAPLEFDDHPEPE